MAVVLLPPHRTAVFGTPRLLPLTEGPRYVRGIGNSRWHCPRSGQTQDSGYTTWAVWCGQHIFDGTERHGIALKTDVVPKGDEVCGTCEGRAIGAGQVPGPDGMPALVFSPRRVTPPRRCPGSREMRLAEWPEDTQGNVLRCLVCRLLVPGRSSGGAYNTVYGPVNHAPGPKLIPPCPWHGWEHVALVDDVIGCYCGWTPETTT